MRTNSLLFWIIGAFFWASSIGYTIWSLAVNGRIEWVGTPALALTGVLGVFLGFYLGRTHSAQGGELPQDRSDANVDDGDPEMGQFSPWSWWPFVMGLGLMMVFLGLAIGVWVSFFGAPLALIAIVGWNYEYYRNNFAR